MSTTIKKQVEQFGNFGFQKQFLIVNAISMDDQASAYYGYALRAGMPLIVTYAFLLKRLAVSDSLFIGFALCGAVIFYMGSHLVLKRGAALAKKKYLSEITRYRKAPHRSMIARSYWTWLAIYYGVSAVLILLFCFCY
jgi:hypothetical protein